MSMVCGRWVVKTSRLLSVQIGIHTHRPMGIENHVPIGLVKEIAFEKVSGITINGIREIIELVNEKNNWLALAHLFDVIKQYVFIAYVICFSSKCIRPYNKFLRNLSQLALALVSLTRAETKFGTVIE